MAILGLDSPIETPVGSPAAAATSTPFTTPQTSLTAYSRKFYRKGFQTVTWSASDPNDDRLNYDVLYRSRGESLWKILREDVRVSVVAWDTVAMPDGRYTLKIIASDTPSNPADLSLKGEKESRSFDVDNTPPRLKAVQASRSDGGHHLTFRAEDDASAIRIVEYAVDSGKWNVVYPTDGICDSKQEDFDVAVPGYAEGVHILVVKVTDLLDNIATARVELR
jgi:hypothetical protein